MWNWIGWNRTNLTFKLRTELFERELFLTLNLCTYTDWIVWNRTVFDIQTAYWIVWKRIVFDIESVYLHWLNCLKLNCFWHSNCVLNCLKENCFWHWICVLTLIELFEIELIWHLNCVLNCLKENCFLTLNLCTYTDWIVWNRTNLTFKLRTELFERELFYTLNLCTYTDWIVWNRTVYMYKNGCWLVGWFYGISNLCRLFKAELNFKQFRSV